jgi:hypothetical protein
MSITRKIDTCDKDEEVTTISEAAKMLGNGVTVENVYARIRRGSLEACQDERGEFHILLAEIHRVFEEAETCGNCSNLAASLVIIKYHHHDRVEFTLCAECANKTYSAYRRQGGVLEIVVYPLFGEGWMKP